MGTQCSEQQDQLLFIFPASCRKRNLGNNSTATLSERKLFLKYTGLFSHGVTMAGRSVGDDCPPSP